MLLCQAAERSQRAGQRHLCRAGGRAWQHQVAALHCGSDHEARRGPCYSCLALAASIFELDAVSWMILIVCGSAIALGPRERSGSLHTRFVLCLLRPGLPRLPKSGASRRFVCLLSATSGPCFQSPRPSHWLLLANANGWSRCSHWRRWIHCHRAHPSTAGAGVLPDRLGAAPAVPWQALAAERWLRHAAWLPYLPASSTEPPLRTAPSTPAGQGL